ncbi:hypothetical protein SNE40_017360 [Patella caerulea]|uniref:Uncharacterized protein n=1 Tax=Patella caerulea TaxID=87958 RepID=A0AAN8JEV8_PATCE
MIYIFSDAKAAKLTITPSQNLHAGATSLTLRCSPYSNSVYTKLITMEISKRTLVQNSLSMSIAILDPIGVNRIGIPPPKYRVSGSLALPQGFLQIVIDHPDGHDAAEYQCLTFGKLATTSSSVFLKDSKNVTINNVKAAKLTITPSQNLQAGAASLTLRCSPDSNSVYTKLHTIEITKRTLVQNSLSMSIAILDPIGVNRIGIPPPKYAVTGSLALPQGFLQIVIHHPDGHDAAEYQCLTFGKLATTSSSVFLKDSKNVTINNVISDGEDQVPPPGADNDPSNIENQVPSGADVISDGEDQVPPPGAAENADENTDGYLPTQNELS